MNQTQNSPETAAMRLFTPKYRQRVLERLIAHFQSDARIAGVLIVGSAAVGFDDGYSDIDLCVVVANEAERSAVFKDWGKRLHNLFFVLHHLDVVKGEKGLLHVFLLEGFLEVDLGFESLETLTARRTRWRVAYDHSGTLEELLRTSWEKSQKNRNHLIRNQYKNRLDAVWHYIMHAVVAVQRNLPWKAIAEIEELRRQVIELRGLRENLETKRYRYVDRLSPEFLKTLHQTFVSPQSSSADIMTAVRHLSHCFFEEARALDATLSIEYAGEAEEHMHTYLDLFADQP